MGRAHVNSTQSSSSVVLAFCDLVLRTFIPQLRTFTPPQASHVVQMHVNMLQYMKVASRPVPHSTWHCDTTSNLCALLMEHAKLNQSLLSVELTPSSAVRNRTCRLSSWKAPLGNLTLGIHHFKPLQATFRPAVHTNGQPFASYCSSTPANNTVPNFLMMRQWPYCS